MDITANQLTYHANAETARHNAAQEGIQQQEADTRTDTLAWNKEHQSAQLDETKRLNDMNYKLQKRQQNMQLVGNVVSSVAGLAGGRLAGTVAQEMFNRNAAASGSQWVNNHRTSGQHWQSR